MIELEMMKPPCPDKGPDPQANAAGTSGVIPLRYGILIVDDEANVRDMLNTVMCLKGFTVLVAAGGQEALDLYRRHHETVDVVLMDVRMPGPDGPQTLAALQAINPQIRCCFMSGDFGSYSAEKLKNCGAAAILAKPINFAEAGRVLLELAREAYGRRRAAPEE
jgi:DNA-binding NtrC family response regulator